MIFGKRWVRFLCTVIVSFVLLCLAVSAGPCLLRASAQVPVEYTQRPNDWSFRFDNYSVNHQHMSNWVNVTLNYTLKTPSHSLDGSNFTSVFHHITHFLDVYPNEDDYWEVVTRNLTQTLLHEYPEWRSLTLALAVQPRPSLPFTCTSTVTLNDESQMVETWKFSSGDSPVDYHERERINITAEYTYRSGLSDRDYPDFVPIYWRLIQQFASQARTNESWEMMNQSLAALVLAEQPSLTHITLTLNALPTISRPYPYSTQVSLAQPS